MPKFQVTKSQLIKAPKEKVYDNIRNLQKWTAWSPWLILDPESKVTVTDDNTSYSWEGKRMGSGKMTVVDEKTNEWIKYDLLFLTPFKSQADIRFALKQSGANTEVTWHMESRLPFFLFFMKKIMTAFLGMDFQRGLYLLKDYCEDGKIHSRLDFKGISTHPGCEYVGIKTTCAMDDVNVQMTEDFTRLMESLAPDLIIGEPFSIYHKWDIVKGLVTYTSSVPVKNKPAALPDGVTYGQLPATSVYTLRHTGPYLHLGNAWSALNSMQRNKEFKVNKKIHAFETYVNEPSTTPDSELITDVHFPVKN